MADSAESTIARPARARSQKPRASTVSPETESKLARAARSAQRLAQLSDAARDHSTLDLFPDDIARAEQQALNIDVRQGTLQGFELPHVVLAAAGAPEGKAGTRAARGAAVAKDQGDPHHGQMVIDTDIAEGQAQAGSVDSDGEAAVKKPDAPAQAASLAAASVVRSVTALRQMPPPSDAADAADVVVPQRPAASDADDVPVALADAPAPAASHFAPPPPTHTPRATPELDHARATAFADTVDALYGVIADQRRAAVDHTRRMKWMLTIVVCALLMTIAIGITQTMLLFRLARQSTAHEQRIEQMLLNQQATLATLLDTDSSTTSLPVSAVQTPAPVAPAPTPAPPAAKPAEAHASHAHHAQRRKSAHTH